MQSQAVCIITRVLGQKRCSSFEGTPNKWWFASRCPFKTTQKRVPLQKHEPPPPNDGSGQNRAATVRGPLPSFAVAPADPRSRPPLAWLKEQHMGRANISATAGSQTYLCAEDGSLSEVLTGSVFPSCRLFQLHSWGAAALRA